MSSFGCTVYIKLLHFYQLTKSCQMKPASSTLVSVNIDSSVLVLVITPRNPCFLFSFAVLQRANKLLNLKHQEM